MRDHRMLLYILSVDVGEISFLTHDVARTAPATSAIDPDCEWRSMADALSFDGRIADEPHSVNTMGMTKLPPRTTGFTDGSIRAHREAELRLGTHPTRPSIHFTVHNHQDTPGFS
jgi:hypothetical protein